MHSFRKIVCFVALLSVFVACRKPTSANWDVDVVLPVVKSKLNITNFFSDTLIKADNSGLLHININRELVYLKLDTLLNLPTTVITPSPFVTPFNYTLTHQNSLNFFVPTEVEFNIGNDVQLTRVDIKKGQLTVKYSNSISEPLDLLCKIPNATKNGELLLIKETIPPGENSLTKTYDLAGYSLNLRGLDGKKYNAISQSYTINLNPDANEVLVPQGKGASIELSYSDITPAYAEGYFGTQKVDFPTTVVDLGLTDNFSASNFLLSEATMSFNIINEIGADFAGGFNTIKSINSFNSKDVALQNNNITSFRINGATRSANNIKPADNPLVFNNSNSNFASFISNIPNKLSYAGMVEINPLGQATKHHNQFIYFNNGIKILADIDIPIRFTADYFRLKTKADVNLSSVSQLDNVNNGNFVIEANNSYPFDVRLQAYMLNEQNQIIDSIFVNGENTLAAGKFDAQKNEIVSASTSKIYVPLNKFKIENLKNCRSIQTISYVIVPKNIPSVQLLEKFEIDLNIVAEINYNVGLKSR